MSIYCNANACAEKSGRPLRLPPFPIFVIYGVLFRDVLNHDALSSRPCLQQYCTNSLYNSFPRQQPVHLSNSHPLSPHGVLSETRSP